MITLYIKTHRLTGKKYFGKTTNKNPISYPGSGIHWRRHLIKYGYDFDTEIYLQSEDQKYITQEALRFSRAYDIVNSDLWLNLIEENGLDGGLKGIFLSEEHREKLAKAKRGKPQSKEHVENRIKPRVKTWLIVDPDGKEHIIVNLKKFCRENKLSCGAMCDVSKDRIKHHNNYICRKIDKNDDYEKTLQEIKEFKDRLSRNNTTGYTGVIIHNGKYAARIDIDKKRINLGHFDNAEDAHRARLEAKEKYRKGEIRFLPINSGIWKLAKNSKSS